MIDLDATRWQAIRQHFEALLRLRSRDQSAALARIGATDPEMGSALAALLAADEESSGLLRISSGGSGGRAASQGADLLGLADRTISHFRALRPIGAGGMGVVHRDLKPGNLMLLPDGTVRILDFGLAKTLGWGGTTVGAAVGTVPYMAPEQVRGRAVGPATDLWALGVVLY